MSEILNSILPFLQSNNGGSLVCLVLIAWLSLRLNRCEDKHESQVEAIGVLKAAVLGLAGRRNVDGIKHLLEKINVKEMSGGGPGPRRPKPKPARRGK